jgi:thiamine kinase-like enzyme
MEAPWNGWGASPTRFTGWGTTCCAFRARARRNTSTATNEAASARVAASAGVSPEVVFANAGTGVMVTVLVPGAVTMSPENFRTRTGSPARAGQVLRKLHTSGGSFPFRFELFAMIDDYLKVLSTKDVDLPDGYHDVVREAETIRAALARNPAPLVPCHCDPLCENFIDTGERMWVVDWEYSGMNDPMWDLGDLSVEGGFDERRTWRCCAPTSAQARPPPTMAAW